MNDFNHRARLYSFKQLQYSNTTDDMFLKQNCSGARQSMKRSDAFELQPRDIFDTLRKVNVAIAQARSSEEMLVNVLDAMLEIFECDRAWLLYPCALDADWFQIPMERTRPEFPGAGATKEHVPINAPIREIYRAALENDGPVQFGEDTNSPAAEIMQQFQVRSQLLTAIHPKSDQPWLLGIHHCTAPRQYDNWLEIFQAVGQRVADGLTAFIATDELRQSEARLRTLVDTAPNAITVLDFKTGKFIEVNPAGQRLFGHSREELLASTGPLAFSPELQPNGQPSSALVRSLMQTALAGDISTFEWQHVNAQGDVLLCEVSLTHFPHPSLDLLCGSITDITERKRKEEERLELETRLSHAQKMEAIGHLTGGLAHDFNNLLTVILGNLDVMEEDAKDPTFVVEQASKIRAAAERAGALTHRLLAFARRQALRPRVTDIGALLRGMDDLMRRTLGERVNVELVLGGGLWRSEVDPTQLESAILNLAINARDAMPRGGPLTIEASNARLDAEYASGHPEVKEGQYVLIAVTDNGAGMTREVLTHMFTPFFSTKGVKEGTGLGLAMVYGFVKQSGGHVKAYSEVGVGTTMKVYLPRSAQTLDAPDPMAATNTAHKGAGELILVVEDEESVLTLTLTLLEQLGYTTLSATTANAALLLLQQHPEIDLLLSDMVLAGDQTGAELAATAHEFLPDLRVLYMSGYTENAIIHNGRLDPNVNLLEKPFTKRTLSLRLQEALS